MLSALASQQLRSLSRLPSAAAVNRSLVVTACTGPQVVAVQAGHWHQAGQPSFWVSHVLGTSKLALRVPLQGAMLLQPGGGGVSSIPAGHWHQAVLAKCQTPGAML